MPFDALVAVTRQRAISDSLEDHGLKAVPWETLAEHKVLRKNKLASAAPVAVKTR